MLSVWGKAWGKAWGSAWGATTVAIWRLRPATNHASVSAALNYSGLQTTLRDSSLTYTVRDGVLTQTADQTPTLVGSTRRALVGGGDIKCALAPKWCR